MFRIRTTRLRAATAAALLSLSLATPALAGDDRHRGYRAHRHDGHCDHDRRGHGGDRGRWDRGGSWHDRWDDRRDHRWDRRWERGHRDRRHWDRWERGHHRRHRDERWGCRPCRRHWRSQRDFHRHIHQSHGLPYQAIPSAVVVVDWGWMFRG